MVGPFGRSGSLPRTRPALVASSLLLCGLLAGCLSKGEKLVQAPLWGDCAEALSLVRGGADVTVRDERGQTALHRAAAWGRLDLAAMLLERGADPTARDKRGNTPLHCTVAPGTRKEMPFPRSNRFPDRDGRTAIASLLARQKGVDLHAKNDEGDTALHLAVECVAGHGTLKALLAAKADVDVRNSLGRTPLHITAHRGGIYDVRLLLASGADVNARDRYGLTPLHLALTGSLLDEPAVRLLLREGADIHGKDMKGRTPLAYCRKYGSADRAARAEKLLQKK